MCDLLQEPQEALQVLDEERQSHSPPGAAGLRTGPLRRRSGRRQGRRQGRRAAEFVCDLLPGPQESPQVLQEACQRHAPTGAAGLHVVPLRRRDGGQEGLQTDLQQSEELDSELRRVRFSTVPWQ